MRIAYVARFSEKHSLNIKLYILHLARFLKINGHEVYLITDTINDFVSDIQATGASVILVKGTSQDFFFSTMHEYANSVYQVLKVLSQTIHLDVIEFAEYCGEGFMTIRAKKLLHEFPQTRLVVRVHYPTSLSKKVSGDIPWNLEHSIQIYMEDYSLKHADLVTSSSQAAADY